MVGFNPRLVIFHLTRKILFELIHLWTLLVQDLTSLRLGRCLERHSEKDINIETNTKKERQKNRKMERNIKTKKKKWTG